MNAAPGRHENAAVIFQGIVDDKIEKEWLNESILDCSLILKNSPKEKRR